MSNDQAYVTPEDLEKSFNFALGGVDQLRKVIAQYYKEREIDVYDIPGMSASDLIKHVRVVLLTCFPPKRKIT